MRDVVEESKYQNKSATLSLNNSNPIATVVLTSRQGVTPPYQDGSEVFEDVND
jgi:hypothetical protein